MATETFTVDTQLFRELGELLVGEDATALSELIKNAYDADARSVTIVGQHLDEPGRGVITIVDDGTGMTPEQFRVGFLTIAGRTKSTGSRRTAVFGRTFTGEKGVGRLAARKLARRIEIESWPWSRRRTHNGKLIASNEGVRASIDWDKIDKCKSFSEIANSGAVQVEKVSSKSERRLAGTTLRLIKLRRAWSNRDISRFQLRALNFRPPRVFDEDLPPSFEGPLLFDSVFSGQQAQEDDEPFYIEMGGGFQVAEPSGISDARAAHWVLEIECKPERGRIEYGMKPSQRFRERYPSASAQKARIKIPNESEAPQFRARIFNLHNRSWDESIAGIRLYMNGFRVLPYGEPTNDWLGIDDDTTSRARDLLRNLKNLRGDIPTAGDREEETKMQRNSAYWGAVALTRDGASGLEMLVNREGFAPSPQFEFLQKYIRIGVDLLTRVRVSASIELKRARSQFTRAQRQAAQSDNETPAVVLAIRDDSQNVIKAAREARAALASGDLSNADKILSSTIAPLADSIQQASQEMGIEQAMFRVLASLGAQQAAFSHEINGLVSTAAAVGRSLDKILEENPDTRMRSRLASIRRDLRDLHHGLERQAIFLTDIAGLEARRRRSRQNLLPRFESAKRLLERSMEERELGLITKLPSDLKSPAMFPAELVALFTNLLSNAVKFAGRKGRILVSGEDVRGVATIRMENTGHAVNLNDAERWFEPFQSTTTNVNASLGQGMGLGLTITRSLLDEYGATISFVRPSPGYATALEIKFPPR